jgi:autotransporter-associated beta strand protein
VPNNLIIGPSTTGSALVRLFQVGGIGGDTVTVNANSLFDLNGYNQRLTHLNLRDGGNVQTGAGTLSFPAGASVNVGSLSIFGSHVASTISGFLALPLSGAVTFNVSPAAPTPPLLLGPELEVPAVISGGVNHGNSANLTKEGLGQLRLSGNNTFQGNLFVNAGAVIAAHPNAMGTTLSGTFVYNGGELIVEGGINVAGEYIDLDSTNSPALESRNGINTIGGVLYLNRNSQVGPSAPADGLLANGQIDGPGSLIKVGLGTITLGGASANTYAGETFVNQGTLMLNKPSAVTAIPTALEIGALDGSSAGTVGNLNSYQILGNILVHPRGIYDVNGQVENVDFLHLYGGGTVRTGGGSLYLNTGGAIYVYPQTNSTATINGSVVLDPGNHLVTVNTGSALPGVNDLVINAAISQSSTAASLQKEGPGRMRLGGNNTYNGSTTVNAGTLQVDGSQGQSAVTVNSGTLQGSGTVGAVSLTSASATVSPGASPGILNCGSFSGGSGTVRIELNGTTPGGYDQVNVSGSVNLSGMSLNASLGYTSSTNDTFTIINNDGTDAVTGTFSGLPQGKKLYIGQQLFQISYTGGSGNDVVLSRLITPPPPTLTIQKASPASVRLLWATNDPPFSLQTASSMPATNWSTALPLPVVIGTNNVVTNLMSNPQQFYQLSNP